MAPHSLKHYLNHNYGALRLVSNTTGEMVLGVPDDNSLLVQYALLLLFLSVVEIFLVWVFKRIH